VAELGGDRGVAADKVGSIGVFLPRYLRYAALRDLNYLTKSPFAGSRRILIVALVESRDAGVRRRRSSISATVILKTTTGKSRKARLT